MDPCKTNERHSELWTSCMCPQLCGEKGVHRAASRDQQGMVTGRVQEGRGAGERVGGCGLHLEADLIVLAAGLAAWGSGQEESVMTLLSWASNSHVVPVTEMGQPGGETVV